MHIINIKDNKANAKAKLNFFLRAENKYNVIASKVNRGLTETEAETEPETEAVTAIAALLLKCRRLKETGRERQKIKKKTEFPSTQPAKHKKSMKHDNSAKKTIKRKEKLS